MKLLRPVLWALTTAFVANAHSLPSPQHTCVVPALKDGRDDAPAIREAFSKCGNNGKVVFQKDTTYSVQTALQLHNLKNVQVDLFGTLEVWKAAISWSPSVIDKRSIQRMCDIGFYMDRITTSKTFPSRWNSQAKTSRLMGMDPVRLTDKDKCGMI